MPTLLRLLRLLCIALLCSGTALAAELRIALGVADPAAAASTPDPARGTSQSGGLTGFNEDLAREICRRISVRCVLSNVLFAEMLPGLEARRFELGFGNFLRTPEREKRIAFSDVVWRSSSRLLATPSAAARIGRRLGGEITLDTVSHARILAIRDTQQHKYLADLPAARGIVPVVAQSMAETLGQLGEDKADFALLPMLSAFALLSRETAGRFEFVGPPVAEHGLGGTVHIGLPKGNDTLQRQVNQALAEMRADGTYHRIVRRYFPFNLD